MQGDLWRIASRGALGGGLLVLPLVFVVAGSGDFSSLGPFADAWWITLVLAAAGLGFTFDALASSARGCRRVSRAIEAGYDWRSIAFVLADQQRDMGFLLQGGRHFGVLDERERTVVAGLRLLSVSAFALAGLWLPVALGTTLLLASRGAADVGHVWGVTLMPAGLLYALGGVLLAAGDGRVRRARRQWHRHPWSEDLVATEIDAWRRDLAHHGDADDAMAASRASATTLRRVAVLVGAMSVLVAVPVLTLVPASAIGPIVATVAVPRFSQTERRAALAEAYRDYRVAPDPAISPEEAGRILQSLLYVGSSRRRAAGERAPEPRIDEPWLPEGPSPNPLGVEPHRWAEEIFSLARGSLSTEARAYLAQLSAHPAHAAFSRLAHAARVDAGSGRWDDPLPAEVTIATFPIPPVGTLRTGAYAHLAAAALEVANGRPARAETMIREAISVGFLLIDDGPTLLENLVGSVIAQNGGIALASFYRSTGRADEAVRLDRLRGTAERTADRLRAGGPEGIEAFLRVLPGMVTDTTSVRGLRWELFLLTTTLTPCINLHRMVFGPGDDYARFVDTAHDRLVEWPSEEPLFDLARGGYWGAVGDGGGGWLGRLLGVSMRGGEGSCREVMRHLRAIEEAR